MKCVKCEYSGNRAKRLGIPVLHNISSLKQMRKQRQKSGTPGGDA